MYTFTVTKKVKEPATGEKKERKAVVSLPDFCDPKSEIEPVERLNALQVALGGSADRLIRVILQGVMSAARYAANRKLEVAKASDVKAFNDAVEVAMSITDMSREVIVTKLLAQEKYAAFRAIDFNEPVVVDCSDLNALTEPKKKGRKAADDATDPDDDDEETDDEE
jgi:hypothetical protein